MAGGVHPRAHTRQVVVYAFLNADGDFTLHNFGYRVPADFQAVILTGVSLCPWCALRSGYPMAYLAGRLSASKQSLCMMLIMLPMWINFLLRTLRMDITENNGFINQFSAPSDLSRSCKAISAPSLDYIPLINTQGRDHCSAWVCNFPATFMVLPIYTVLIKLDRKLIEAAQDLGAPTSSSVPPCDLPASGIPGVISGITMVFVPSVSTFVISWQMLGSGRICTRRRPSRPSVHGRCVQPRILARLSRS